MVVREEEVKDPNARLLEKLSIKTSMSRLAPERGKDGGGIGREDHLLPHKFLKRTFQRRANSTKQLL